MNVTADVVVVGSGIIGLCCATSIAVSGKSVLVVGEHRKGEASTAAAGMLAPSVEKSEGPAHNFAIAARDIYPAYLEELADQIGIRVPLNRLGVLQVALTERGVRGLQKNASPTSHWIDRKELAHLEPTLGHAIGAVMNPEDGSVDNVILTLALNSLADSQSRVTRHAGAVTKISAANSRVRAILADGSAIESGQIVLAPGAWGAEIDGASALKAITPVRGQLVSYPGIGLRHVTYGPRGYLVPRGTASTIGGSTMEKAGFNAVTTPEGLARVQSAAEEIAPALAITPPASSWAGLRPVTPDMLPILGRDVDRPEIIYACGHSRNGILLAVLTGKVIAQLMSGAPVEHDLSQFRPDRF